MARNKTDQAESRQDAAPGGTDAALEYSHDVLVEMRRRGLPKPAAVTQAAWDHAVPPAVVPTKQLMRQHIGTHGIKQGDKTVFNIATPEALEAIFDVMTDPSESGRNKLAAASIFVEQSYGKPGQIIEHTGNVVLDFRKQCEELEKSGYNPTTIIDVEATKPIEIDAATAAVDDFLATHAPDGFSVGKKTSGKE